MRPIGTYLYGRRMYEVMAGWEKNPTLASASPVMRDFAELWRAADKVVYSTTLATASTARTRIEPDFGPGAVRQLKPEAGSDLLIGGPDLAGQAIREGLVDECHLLLAPIAVGGGKRSPPTSTRWVLELIEERPFDSGMVHVRYGDRT